MDKRLIVNADDYGISKGVNRGVIEGHLSGIITSSSVMTNMPFARAGLSKARLEAPDLGLGLHVNLTWGCPVLSPKDVPSLVSGDGIFKNPFHLLVSPPDPDHVQAEMVAQFNRFIEFGEGLMPDHLDSHQFITYTLPSAFSAMLELAARHSLPIRSPAPFQDMDIVREMIKAVAGGAPGEQALVLFRPYMESNRQHLAQARYTRWPEHFEYRFYDRGSSKENLIHILRHLDPATTEIMCHPGYGMDIEETEGYREPRERELKILTALEIKEVVEAEHIKLVKFSDL